MPFITGHRPSDRRFERLRFNLGVLIRTSRLVQIDARTPTDTLVDIQQYMGFTFDQFCGLHSHAMSNDHDIDLSDYGAKYLARLRQYAHTVGIDGSREHYQITNAQLVATHWAIALEAMH